MQKIKTEEKRTILFEKKEIFQDKDFYHTGIFRFQENVVGVVKNTPQLLQHFLIGRSKSWQINNIEEYDIFEFVIIEKAISLYYFFNSIIFVKLTPLNKYSANTKVCLDKIKHIFSNSKIIIFNSGKLSSGNTIAKDMIKFGFSSGNRLKNGLVDNKNYLINF